MSHSFRQTVGAQPPLPVASTPLSGRMSAPLHTSGSPAGFPVMPNYNLLSNQPQQFITQPLVYPQAMQNIQNRSPFVAAAIPTTMPRMFIPVAPVPAGIGTSIPDPTRLLEEQRKLEKERNFQLQQERLKQFTVAGKRGNINAENLIDSMFGKFQPKKNSSNLQSALKVNALEASERKNVAVSLLTPVNCEPALVNQNMQSQSLVSATPIKKDVKELDSMMLECSNLNAPSKAARFQKTCVKETAPSSSQGTTFIASDKAVDWRNIKGLEEVFITPKPRFPNWCTKKKVPELFRTIEMMVTDNSSHPPDTQLLFPIMISSGLSHDLLGQIWELVNESASGQLSVEEMYAALALIALFQAGYSVTSIDILHQLPSCPAPQLNYFSSEVPGNSSALLSKENATSESSLSKQPTHQVIRPTAISVANNTQMSTNVNESPDEWTSFTGSASVPSNDFEDFKSVTPTAINFSLSSPSSNPVDPDDEFDDFKQAPNISTTDTSVPFAKKPLESKFSVEVEKQASEVPQDLMSQEEDKYSVFRSLQQNDDASQWGNFTTVNNKKIHIQKEATDAVYPSVLVTESTDIVDGLKSISSNPALDDDEFGDFLHADIPPTSVFATVADFADFSSFKHADCDPTCGPTQIDDEFGEFTSSVPISLKPETGQEFFFRHLKDNISLAESQSVSSLELGTFDGGGGHSGESKSSLSRQGSIPSLDLKSVGLDGTDTEDGLGEIQLSPFVPRASKSPSPVNNKGSDDSESTAVPPGLFFQTSTLPLTDKYSVIRQEKTKEEDHHISSWIRCLKSCVNILQNTKKIFNQMSCSFVCNEVLMSEEGGNYVKNVIEVYKVVCRIRLSSKSFGKQTISILDLLNEADQIWHTVCGFFAGSTLMPKNASLDFSNAVLQSEPENNTKACGLCLLNVETRSKCFKQEDNSKLSYGGRNYHSTCANLWVNCVDPLLPALILPQLL